MKVVFSERSIQRLREIQAYIAEDDPVAAAQVIARVRQSIEMLRDHPKLGRVWTDGRTRALSVSGLPYRVHYRVTETEEVVQIITVAHTSRNPPKFD